MVNPAYNKHYFVDILTLTIGVHPEGVPGG